MKKSRFSETQIVGILNAVEMGAKVGEMCRKYGISEPTYYKWKSQFSGMTVSHLAQLRELQEENAKLKRMYADLALMHHARTQLRQEFMRDAVGVGVGKQRRLDGAGENVDRAGEQFLHALRVARIGHAELLQVDGLQCSGWSPGRRTLYGGAPLAGHDACST